MEKSVFVRKQEVRSRYLERRNELSLEERRQKSGKIKEFLMREPVFQKARTVLVYMDYRSEVMTTELVEELLLLGTKRVFAPRVEGMDIEFYEVRSMADFEKGYQGIREPKSALSQGTEKDILERFRPGESGAQETDGACLILVPGSVFDRQGGRMGYGKGFYDRFLAGAPFVYSVGLAFECQVAGRVPTEAHDRRIHMLITEEGVTGMQENAVVAGGPAYCNLTRLGEAAAVAKYELQGLETEKKNQVLRAAARALVSESGLILAENQKDLERGEKRGMSAGLLDRLRLSGERIAGMAQGLEQVAALPDPVGEIMETMERPNGLRIEKRRVPVGVIGIIYESRPNVTADAFGLCFKSGNAVILKGGSDALCSNRAITGVIRRALSDAGVCEDAISLIDSTDRAVTQEFMRMKQYVDLLIPRGGAGLIRSVVENSTIPVIETGTGNCHIYVDESADIEKAIPVIVNAKTQRIGVCNACESLVIHEKIKDRFLPALADALRARNVEIRGDEQVRGVIDCTPATQEDFGTEYLDYIISMKTVSSLKEAIAHINRYGTRHSEAILTEDAACAEEFLNQVDAACVYANASTRFTDGFEFGFGAEIGISTQKLHARGPMGLKELTSYKYVVRGNGQVRG